MLTIQAPHREIIYRSSFPCDESGSPYSMAIKGKMTTWTHARSEIAHSPSATIEVLVCGEVRGLTLNAGHGVPRRLSDVTWMDEDGEVISIKTK